MSIVTAAAGNTSQDRPRFEAALLIPRRTIGVFTLSRPPFPFTK